MHLLQWFAHELGRRLGCGAHLTSLRRESVGGYSVEDAVSGLCQYAVTQVPHASQLLFCVTVFLFPGSVQMSASPSAILMICARFTSTTLPCLPARPACHP